MEAVMQKWEGLDTEDKEVVLRQQRAHLHIDTTNNGIEGSATFSTSEISIGVDAGIHLQNGENGKNNDLLQNAKNKNLLPAPVPPIFESSTSPSYLTTQSAPVGIVIQNKDEEQEFYLKKIFIMPPSHGFYCPNCKVCIEKVLVYKNQDIDDDRIRCSACFRFLIRIGNQLLQGWRSKGIQEPSTVVTIPPEPHDPVPQPPATLPADQPPATLPKQNVAITPGSSKAWEILKSIVYGGLIEVLASLSVVTSAASADATTLNIVALAIANLIGGIFVLGHNLWELKAEKPRANGEDSQTDAPVDRYSKLLGDKDNFILHAFVAILSFLVFGLVPPVVYGFSFYESNDKDFKLAAVAGASLLCITLLAIAKTYIQSTNSYLTYFKTVFYYVSIGALASVLTYVAGALLKRLVESLGWFEPRSNIGLFLPEMSVEKPGWGSY